MTIIDLDLSSEVFGLFIFADLAHSIQKIQYSIITNLTQSQGMTFLCV
jgi:hypothetical protein